MLAAFMVADRIEVISRTARGDCPAMRWTGMDDGTFEVVELADDGGLAEPGTLVRLHARPDMAEWTSAQTVLSLTREYGSPAALLGHRRGHPGHNG